MQSSVKDNKMVGWWTQGDTEPELGDQAVRSALLRVTHPVSLLTLNGLLAVGRGGTITIGNKMPQEPNVFPLDAYAPPLHPENLGDPQFKKTHNLRYAYIAGAMAPAEKQMGHAGAIISGGLGSAESKMKSLEEAGVTVAKRLDEVLQFCG